MITSGLPEATLPPQSIGSPTLAACSPLIRTVLLPLAITGVLGLAAVVLVHEVAEVVVIANGLRAARARKPIGVPSNAITQTCASACR